MRNLVPHDAHGPKFYQIVVRFIFFQLEEALIIPRKRKYASSFSDAR